uniref:Anaphase-promoting complex subunit 4 WD40 domain-containing protein n=1 Tax=Fibrocapsa japonica TaxID=94617 RepID=A0A7S2UWQ1_9STRA|mmetsp:Transcript_17553/g.25612  ORF Transcript_17553/g.25612 Transcript_17553/m.25612 type:complete len:667 (+) Transcript_17553:168-2168(+)
MDAPGGFGVGGYSGRSADTPGAGGGDDVMELEHVLGYTGHFLQTLACHPTEENVYVKSLGSIVVIGDLADPHQSSYLRGHDMEVSTLAISPSGNLIASGQMGTTHHKGYYAPVMIWEMATRRQLFILEGITGRVNSLSFSPDEAFVCGYGQDGLLYIWELQGGEVVFGKRYAAPVSIFQWCSAYNEAGNRRPKYQVILIIQSEVKVGTLAFDPSRRQWNLDLEPMNMPGSGLVRDYLVSALTEDRQFCMCGTAVGDLAVFRTSTRVYRASVPVSSGGLTALTTVGSSLLCGAGDGTVKKLVGSDTQWQLQAEVQLDGRVTSIAPRASRQEVVVGTSRGSVYRVAVADLAATCVSSAHVERLCCGAFPNNRVSSTSAGADAPQARSDVFASGSCDGSLLVWNLNDYSLVCRTGERESGALLCMGWVGTTRVATGWEDCCVRCYNVEAQGAMEWHIPNAHRAAITSLAVHHDERLGYIVTGAKDGAVRLWNLRSREMLLQFTEHQKGVSKVIVDVRLPKLVHSAGLDCAVLTYDIQKERRTVAHMVREGAFLGLSQRVDSEQELVTCDAAGRIFFWDCDVQGPTQALQDPSRDRIRAVSVSPSGHFMAIGGEDHLVKVLDLTADGDILAVGRGHSAPVSDVFWSPDEKQIISIGDDCCVCIWNFYGPS